MNKRFSGFVADQKASVSTISAVSFVALFGVVALAVDTSAYFLLKRRLQSAADLSSISAAADIANARTAALASLASNGFDATALETIERGTYVASAAVAPANRFVPGGVGGQAVRVTLRIDAPRFFGRVFSMMVPAANAASQAAGTQSTGDGVTIRARAVSALTPTAAFAVGSRLAQLDGGVLNGVLGGLLGTNLSLSLMDYQALASANVDLFAFSAALASRLSLTAASYSDVAKANARVGDVLRAAADVAGGASAVTLSRIANAVPGGATAPVSSLVSFGPYDIRRAGGTPMPLTVTALDLVVATAGLANGRNQVQANLATSLPGIASATIQLVTGDRPVGTSFAQAGPVGATASTAQTRVLLTVSLVGAPPATLVSLPIYIELASATAKPSSLACASGATPAAATLAVMPSAADAWIGAIPSSDFANFATSPNPPAATLANVLGLVAVSGKAHAAITNLAPASVSFSGADIAAATKKTVSTTDYTAALVASLLGSLQISTTTLGLGLGAPANAGSTVVGVLTNAAPSVDLLLDQVLTALGVGIGQADSWVTGVRCQPALVY